VGVTHIRYLLDQWRRRWETVAALHALERDRPASWQAPNTSRKDPGEAEVPETPRRAVE